MSTATFLMSKDEGKKPMNANATPRRGPNVGSSKWHTVGSTAFANYWCDTRSLIAAFWRSTTWLQQSWRSERSSWTKTLFTDKFLKPFQNLPTKHRSVRSGPDGHFKIPHLWPVKFPQAGRLNYQLFGLAGSDFLSW